jgi:hypothetical protein
MRPVDFEDIFHELIGVRWRKHERPDPPFGGSPTRRTAPRDAW